MKNKISIVHIDDNLPDREYLKQILKKQSLFTLENYFAVSTLDQLNDILSNQKIDIVLTDMNLKDFTGMDVIKFVKENFPDTSVLVLTGTGTEELAVEALKQGATDYITKKTVNYERLPEKIQSIVNQKKLEKELASKDRYLKALTDYLPEAIIDVKLPERIITFATKGIINIFGYKPEEVLGKETSIFFNSKKEFELFGEKVKNAIKRKQRFVEFTTLLKKKNGDSFFAEIVSTFVYNESGKIEKTIDIVRDITEEYAKEREIIFERNKFQSLFDTSVDAIFLLNKDGIFIDANNAAIKLFECDKIEIIGKSPLFFSPERQENGELSSVLGKDKVDKALRGIPQQFEWIHKTAKEKTLNCLVSLNSFRLGNLTYLTAIVKDITEKKRLEKSLKEQNQLMSHIFTLSPAINYILNPEDFSLKWYSKNLERVLGYSEDEIKDGKDWWFKNVYREDFEKKDLKLPSIFKSKHIVREYRFYKKDRTLIWIKDELVLIEDKNGNPQEILGVWLDITDEKKKEIESEERKKLLEAITSNSTEGIILLNEKGEIVFWNNAMEKITGYSEKEVLNKIPHSFLAPLEVQKHIEKGNNLYTKGRLSKRKLNYTHIAKTKDGEKTVLEISLSDFKLYERYFVLAIVRNITERKEMEQKIEEERKKFELTLHSIEDAIIVIGKKEEIILLNSSAERLLGKPYTELKGKKLSRFLKLTNEKGIDCKTLIKDFFEKKTLQKLPPEENMFTLQNKREPILSLSLSPLYSKGDIEGVVVVLRDVTERIRMLETNSRISKLEAISTLAGGIAHDFNNMLTSLYGYLDLAKRVTVDPRVKNYLEKSIKTSDRAKSLASRLLALSKKQAPIKKVQDISDNIIDVVAFTTSGTAIETKYQLEPLPFVNVDAAQIEEVIENIVINAVQAMEGKGIIRVEGKVVNLNKKEIGILPEGKYVKISISDTGPGIPDKLKNKIFEPFFTTKKNGSGIGLAACYSIIRKHDGWIDFESKKGEGTTFNIYLPVAEERTEAKPETKEREVKEQPENNGTILLMDDNDEVREVIKEFLYVLGYNVIEAQRGEEVIEFFENKVLSGEIKLKALILDIVIKNGLNGIKTCEKIREYDKNIPILAISGFSDDSVISKPGDFGFNAGLRKPVSINKLKETLEKMIPYKDKQ